MPTELGVRAGGVTIAVRLWPAGESKPEAFTHELVSFLNG